MDNLSLGLKKLIFSKRDASATGSSPRHGRERSRVHKFGKSRPRRDSSPFEEVKADTIEMVEKTEQDFDEEGLKGLEEGTGYRPRDMSGFEEIDWPEVDGNREKPNEDDSEKAGLGSEESSEYRKSAAVHANQEETENPGGQEVQETDKERKGDDAKDHTLENPDAVSPEDEDIPIRPVMYGTPSMSESIEAELDDVEWRAKAERHEPITREQFMGYFDSDGRIVDENELRRTIFKGGVEQDIRKEVWQFLYELYPCNSTIREREVMKTEHRIRYEALKTRWHPILKQISQDLSLGVHFCPEWLRKKKTAKQLHYEVERSTETIAELDENNDCKLKDKDDFGLKEEINVEEVTRESLETERGVVEDEDVASDVFVAGEGEISFDNDADSKLIETENIKDSPPDIKDNLNGKIAVKTGVALCNEAVAEVHGRSSQDIKEAIQDAMLEEPRNGKSGNVMVTMGETVTEETEQESVIDSMRTKTDALLISNNVEELPMNSKPLVHLQDQTDNMESNASPVTTNGFYYVETADLVSPRDNTRSVPKSIDTEENESLMKFGSEILTSLESENDLMTVAIGDVLHAKIDHDLLSSCDKVDNTEVNSPFFQERVADFQEIAKKDDFESIGIENDLQERSTNEDLSTLTDSNAEVGTVEFQENLIDFQESEKTENDEKENIDQEKKNASDVSDIERDIDAKQRETIPRNYLLDSMKNHGINPFLEIDPEAENSLFETQEQELCFDESEGDESINISALDEDLYSRASPEVNEMNSTGVNPFNDSGSFLEESQREISENFYPEVSNTEVGLSTLQQDIDISMQDNTVLSEFMSSENIQQLDENALEFDDVYGNNAHQLQESGTGFRYPDEQLGLIAFSPIEPHNDSSSYPKTRTEENKKLEAGNLSLVNPRLERLDFETTRPDCIEREAGGRRDQELEVASLSPIRPLPEQRSTVAVRPESLDFAKAREKQPEQVGAMPPWLAQQLKASSPAGTKITKTLHIHEGGIPPEEDTATIVSLREIAEKASLEVKKRLIEQGQHVPRSSTPVEFSGSENGNRGVSEESNNQKENVDLMDVKRADLGDKKSIPRIIGGDDEHFDGATAEERTLHRLSFESKSHTTGDQPYRPCQRDDKLIQIGHRDDESTKEPALNSSLITGSLDASKGQSDRENAEHGAWFDNEIFEGTTEIVDPETGEFKDAELKLGAREKRSNSKRCVSVSEILEPTDQVIPRITQPKNHETIRKSYSTANIRDYPRTDSPDIGTFNLLRNLDESISKSDSDVYKAEQRRAPSPYRDPELYQHDSCKYCCGGMERSQDFPDGFGDDLKQYIEIQAKVNAGRQVFNVENVSEALRIIDKDVPRTDRELPYFKGNENPNLLKLRDALITYSFYHPDVGYAQGMNDVMSRFFVVMESESEAYWMFCNYMEHFKGDFMEKDMLRKISLVEQLLMKMDRELYDFFQELQMELIFCHRWLLLSFKREFSYEDGLRMFEIMSSRHLEVSSVEAEMERSRERARELEKDEGSRMEEIYVSPEYSFDVFVCVAMLHECRDILMSTNDMANIYQIMTSLPQVNDLDTILSKAEDLFFKYCRKSTMDCFQLIDEEPAQKILNWKQRLHLDF